MLVALNLLVIVSSCINAFTLYPSHEVDIDDLILNYLGYILMIGIIFTIKKRNVDVYNRVRKIFVVSK